MTQTEWTPTDPATVKVGDHVSFKSDVEQSAEVIEVRADSFIVKAPLDGFSGNYIGRDDIAEIYKDEIW